MNDSIYQKTVFENRNASELYDIYMDDHKHKEAVHPKARECSLKNCTFKERHGKIIHSVKDNIIIQLWRSDGPWKPEDMDSLVILKFNQINDNAEIELNHLYIPENARQFVNKDAWDFLYWNPIKEYLKK
ncbi:SRPBCC family protein [Aquimarina sediminis]|uniref:hypothetical protein n=1 Tax=Aquimarina sediminis TaxID=2070536 RepID=UPI000CA08201|nr:hypothetical protein [Aquimarina sediminis]